MQEQQFDPVSGSEDWIDIRLPLDASAPAAARVIVAEVLAGVVADVVIDGAQLVMSELVTNSVQHSGASVGDALLVRVGRFDGGFRLEVEDSGQAGFVAPRVADLRSDGGFGLHLVEDLSERWGVERDARRGTRVWAEFSNTPSPAEPYYGEVTLPLHGIPGAQNGKRPGPASHLL